MAGFVDMPRLPGIAVYPIRPRRPRIEPAHRVGAPRHLVIPRLASEDIVEILELTRDRMMLSCATREMARDAHKR